jgi:hypothetical protein
MLLPLPHAFWVEKWPENTQKFAEKPSSPTTIKHHATDRLEHTYLGTQKQVFLSIKSKKSCILKSSPNLYQQLRTAKRTPPSTHSLHRKNPAPLQPQIRFHTLAIFYFGDGDIKTSLFTGFSYPQDVPTFSSFIYRVEIKRASRKR